MTSNHNIDLKVCTVFDVKLAWHQVCDWCKSLDGTIPTNVESSHQRTSSLNEEDKLLNTYVTISFEWIRNEKGVSLNCLLLQNAMHAKHTLTCIISSWKCKNRWTHWLFKHCRSKYNKHCRSIKQTLGIRMVYLPIQSLTTKLQQCEIYLLANSSMVSIGLVFSLSYS